MKQLKFRKIILLAKLLLTLTLSAPSSGVVIPCGTGDRGDQVGQLEDNELQEIVDLHKTKFGSNDGDDPTVANIKDTCCYNTALSETLRPSDLAINQAEYIYIGDRFSLKLAENINENMHNAEFIEVQMQLGPFQAKPTTINDSTVKRVDAMATKAAKIYNDFLTKNPRKFKQATTETNNFIKDEMLKVLALNRQYDLPATDDIINRGNKKRKSGGRTEVTPDDWRYPPRLWGYYSIKNGFYATPDHVWASKEGYLIDTFPQDTIWVNKPIPRFTEGSFHTRAPSELDNDQAVLTRANTGNVQVSDLRFWHDKSIEFMKNTLGN